MLSRCCLQHTPTRQCSNSICLQALELHTSLRENMGYGNLKLLIMTIASVSALVAQFYPIPFPDNRVLLGVCVVIYFGLSGVLQLMTSYLDGDYIYKSKVVAGSGELHLRSQMPKHDEWYTLIAECPKGNEIARYKSSVGAYFTAAGDFSTAALDSAIAQHIAPAVNKVVVKKSQ